MKNGRTSAETGGAVFSLVAVCAIALLMAVPAQAIPVTLLQGTVTDQVSGLPVSGAAVTLYGSGFVTVNTDASGVYTIDASQWPYTGSAQMWIVKAGYFTPVLSVNIVTPFPVIVNHGLIPGGSLIGGVVTDASTTLPISNANISYSSGSFYPGATTRSVQSNLSGNYTIDSSEFNESVAVTGPTVSMTVTASGYIQSTASVHAGPVYPTTRNFPLTPATTTLLQGTVTDQATGLPVSGAAVTLYGAGFLTVNTDASGNYAITGLQWPYTGSAQMWIIKTGYFTPVLSVNITTPFPVTVNRALIPSGPVITGTVTDASTSLPIANATISYSSGSFYPGATTRSVQSDLSGNYAIPSSDFNDSVAVTGPTVFMTVSASGYLQSTASVHAAPTYPAVRNFPLTPATTTLLQGTVTDQVTGLPVSGAAVTLYGAGFLTVNTDAGGNYSVTGLQWPYTGSAQMWIVKSGYFTPVLSVNLTTPFPVIVNRALIPGGPLIRGRVTDLNTGARIANASVSYSSGSFYPGATTRSVQTDIAGDYAIPVSDFNDSIAGTGTTVFLTVSSNPGYIQATASVAPAAPYPLVKDFALMPTGVTKTITIATNPSGLNIAVDSAALVATQTFVWTPGNPHTLATTSPQTGPPGIQYVYANWSNAGTQSQTIVTPAVDTTYTANFQTQYLLTTASNPPAGGAVTAGGWFNAGNTLTISASANPGYQFTGFSGDLSGMTNPHPLAMNGPRTVTANFSLSTTTSLGSSDNPSAVGQSVTFTATVAGSSGTPTGTVQFAVDSVNFGAPVGLVAGLADFSTSSLSIGSHTVTAVYSGDPNFTPSSSTILTQVVGQASQTISFGPLSNQPLATAPFPVSATATSLMPVSFASSSPAICTVSGANVTLVSAGLCSIQATQAGDANYLPAPSVTESFQVTSDTGTLSGVQQIRYISNLTAGDSVVNVTNTGAHGASLYGPGFGGAAGNLCVNVYAFSPDEQLVACCSCLITPNGLVHMTANSDLVSNTLTGIRPNSLVVKLVSTGAGQNFDGSTCANSAALAGTAAFPLADGMFAWGTTLHSATSIDPPPAGSSFSITETPFLPATLQSEELGSLTSRCANIIGNGSTFGQCRSCRQGGLGGSKQ